MNAAIEFEQGLKQFEGLPDNDITRLRVLMYLNDFLEKHPDDIEFIMAYAINGFKNPYEGML